MDKFEEVRLNHIYKEGNSEVDKVANIGANEDDKLQLVAKISNIETS